MDDQLELAFEFVQSLSKQLITLATGVLTLSIAFLRSLPVDTGTLFRYLKISWVLYLLSISCGIWTLMALAGSLAPVDSDPAPPAAIESNVRIPSGLQIITFVAGTLVIMLLGFRARLVATLDTSAER